MSEREEFKFEILEDLTKPYRLSTKAQVLLYIISLLTTDLVAYLTPISLEIKIAGIIFVAALLYPYIIKVVNTLTESIGIALYAGSVFVIAYLIIKYIGFPNIRTTALLVIFLEVLSIEMFHHIAERFRIEKTKVSYVITVVLSVIFLIALYIVLSPLGVIVGGVITAIITVIFGYAILPERPF